MKRMTSNRLTWLGSLVIIWQIVGRLQSSAYKHLSDSDYSWIADVAKTTTYTHLLTLTWSLYCTSITTTGTTSGIGDSIGQQSGDRSTTCSSDNVDNEYSLLFRDVQPSAYVADRQTWPQRRTTTTTTIAFCSTCIFFQRSLQFRPSLSYLCQGTTTRQTAAAAWCGTVRQMSFLSSNQQRHSTELMKIQLHLTTTNSV